MGLKIGQAGRAVFVYGSLMYLPVWGQVVKGVYACKAATANGFQRYAVPGETYPAMVRTAGAAVRGLVWLDVNADDIARLDAFEGSEYAREEINIEIEGTGEVLLADTYLWLKPDVLVGELWQVARFEAEGMQQFLGKHVGNWNTTGQRK